MGKIKLLEVGQCVRIETITMLSVAYDSRRTYEYEIVDANNFSAYGVRVDKLKKYKEDRKNNNRLRKRIIQRTREVKTKGLGETHCLWETQELFEDNVRYNVELKEVRKEAHELVDKMNLEELETLLSM